MVEGPGVTRNARKMQPANGGTVVVAAPSSRQHHPQAPPQSPNACFRWTSLLAGKSLQEAFSVGKELFLIFSEDVALRLHFGMNGSLVLHNNNNNNRGHHPSWYAYKKQQSLSLQLHFQKETITTANSTGSRGITPFLVQKDDNPNHQSTSTTPQQKQPQQFLTLSLECFGTAVSQVSTTVAHSKFARLHTLDVCAPDHVFDPLAVKTALLRGHCNDNDNPLIIADALLDQSRFPGVGNIIKIEGLHAARVHPKRPVTRLTDEELDRVIAQCRRYAMEWLTSGRAARKQLVYNQTTCGSCHSNVRMVKLGTKNLPRVTFWCEQCQPFVPGVVVCGNHHTQEPTTNHKKRPLTNVLRQSNASASNKHPRLLQPSSSVNTPPPPPPPQHILHQNNKHARCPQHGQHSFRVQRVRHKEHNKYRLFGTCRKPGCPYFVWMDTHFPKCPSCHRKTVLRISKTERTSGRWFLSCSSTNNSNNNKHTNNNCQGRFFAWATPQQLEPLGAFLTPLL